MDKRFDKTKKYLTEKGEIGFQELIKLEKAMIDKAGRELLNPMSETVQFGEGRALPLQDQINRCIRGRLSRLAEANQVETFEESQDFEVDEDPEPISDFEIHDMKEDFVTPPEANKEPEGANFGAPVEKVAEEISKNVPDAPDYEKIAAMTGMSVDEVKTKLA